MDPLVRLMLGLENVPPGLVVLAVGTFGLGFVAFVRLCEIIGVPEWLAGSNRDIDPDE